MSPPVQAARVYTHHHHLLLLLSPKADTHFTVPRRVEGWVDLVGWCTMHIDIGKCIARPVCYAFIEIKLLPYVVSAKNHIITARRVCLPVRPSVCHTPVLCLNGYTYQNIFTSGSPTILVFPYQTGWQYSDGDPLTGASNASGVWKNHDYRPNDAR